MSDKKLLKEQEKARCKIWSVANKAWNELNKLTGAANLLCEEGNLNGAMQMVERLCHKMEALEDAFVQPPKKILKTVDIPI